MMKWVAGVIIGLAATARAQWPEYAFVIDALLAGLAAAWGVNLIGVVKDPDGSIARARARGFRHED